MSTGFGSGYMSSGVAEYERRRARLNSLNVGVCGVDHPRYEARCYRVENHDGSHIFADRDEECFTEREEEQASTTKIIAELYHRYDDPEKIEERVVTTATKVIAARMGEKYRLSVSIDQSWREVVQDVIDLYDLYHNP